ncbi:MAG: hypothetical protein ACXVC7_04220 [Bacteroidia bacterium]
MRTRRQIHLSGYRNSSRKNIFFLYTRDETKHFTYVYWKNFYTYKRKPF